MKNPEITLKVLNNLFQSFISVLFHVDCSVTYCKLSVRKLFFVLVSLVVVDHGAVCADTGTADALAVTQFELLLYRYADCAGILS